MPRPAPKAPHPADERRAAVLDNPAGYAVSIRAFGRNNTLRYGITRERDKATTLLIAALAGIAVERAAREHGAGTAAIVYALPRDGGGHEVVDSALWRGMAANHMQAHAAKQVAAAAHTSNKG